EVPHRPRRAGAASLPAGDQARGPRPDAGHRRSAVVGECQFAVLGAGAMGSIVGAHLARAGHAVIMLARGARAAHLEQHGLSIRGLSDFTVRVPVLRDPAALGAAGTLIVATKTPGTAAALAPLQAATLGSALSLQNGVLKDELLAQAFGRAQVL